MVWPSSNSNSSPSPPASRRFLPSITASAQRLKAVVDSLGRQITLSYDVNDGGSFGTRDEITFPDYVAYAVLNESFANVDKYEEYTGQFFRTYSKSHFLDYVGVATFASDDYPGKSTHYEIPCLDHIVEVISVGEPQIRDLARA